MTPTPGHWIVTEHTEHDLGEVTFRRICRQSPHGPVEICLNSTKGDPDAYEHKCNARLMAAAPDLLYAAVRSMCILQILLPDPRIDKGEIDNLREAIAEATDALQCTVS